MHQPPHNYGSTLDWTAAAARLAQQGEAYVLITLLQVTGSSPRDAGTKMLVSNNASIGRATGIVGALGLAGTIGGGHLEHTAIQQARQMLAQGIAAQHLEEYPLGAKLGQCCGGRVSVLYECFAATALPIALFGAGHVARALVTVLAQLPVRITWIDSREQEFPADIPANVNKIVADEPEKEVLNLVAGSYVLAMTHLHPLDYSIAENVLKRGDAVYLGVIGSTTKARRFRLRLEHRGFSKNLIDSVHCPIGTKQVPGKQPMEIAVSIAADIIAFYHVHQTRPTIPQRIPAPPVKALLGKLDNKDFQ
jgi:xanthine dehydrogenase accessory factor